MACEMIARIAQFARHDNEEWIDFYQRRIRWARVVCSQFLPELPSAILLRRHWRWMGHVAGLSDWQTHPLNPLMRAVSIRVAAVNSHCRLKAYKQGKHIHSLYYT